MVQSWHRRITALGATALLQTQKLSVDLNDLFESRTFLRKSFPLLFLGKLFIVDNSFHTPITPKELH